MVARSDRLATSNDESGYEEHDARDPNGRVSSELLGILSRTDCDEHEGGFCLRSPRDGRSRLQDDAPAAFMILKRVGDSRGPAVPAPDSA